MSATKNISPLLKFIPHILGIGVIIIVFLVSRHNSGVAIDKAKVEFPYLTYEQSLSERIIEIYCPEEVKCSIPPIWVIFSGGKKKSINVVRSIGKMPTLKQVISVGDSLVKGPKDNSLFIYKVQNGDTLKFTFILCDDLGSPLKEN